MRRMSAFIFLLFSLASGLFAGRHLDPNTAIGKNGPFIQPTASPLSPLHGRRPGRGTALDDVVLFEDFEATVPGQLPAGWTEVDLDGGYCSWFGRNSTWEVYSSPGFSAHSGTRFAMCHFNDGGVPNDDWLILPAQNLGGPVTFSFWAASEDPNYPESFEVRVSTGGTQPQDFTHLMFTTGSVPGVWTQYSQDLSEFAGAPFILAFHYNADNAFALKLDDIEIDGAQGAVGAIAGTVSDDSLRPVNYAKIEVQGLDRSVRTDSLGRYIIGDLPIGSSVLHVTDEFHYPHDISGITVAAGETTRVDAALESRPLRFWEYVSQNIPQNITDFDTVRINIPMCHDSQCDTLIMADLDATVSLTHSYVGDLDIWLQSPDSDYIQLVAHDPSNAGHDILNCRFDDEADLPFTAGHAPYTGRFRPLTSLTRYIGDTTISVFGHYAYGYWWHVYVYDAMSGDNGTLFGFALHIATQIPVPAGGPRPLAPREFSFEGNFPNPFNSQTRLRFVLPRNSGVTLKLYNILGEQAAVILDRPLEAGEHVVLFDGGSLPSGVYFARLSASGSALTRKILLIK